MHRLNLLSDNVDRGIGVMQCLSPTLFPVLFVYKHMHAIFSICRMFKPFFKMHALLLFYINNMSSFRSCIYAYFLMSIIAYIYTSE